VPPTAIDAWIDIYPFLDLQDWSLFYKLPFEVISEPYFQSFQYKILNRILNNKENLYKWKLVDDNKCSDCDSIDTLEHHLVHCKISKQMWEMLELWLKDNLEVDFKLTECEIIFGIPANNSVELKIINYLLILVKWYINKNKSLNRKLYFLEVLQLIKNKIECLILVNEAKGIPPLEWHDRLYCIF